VRNATTTISQIAVLTVVALYLNLRISSFQLFTHRMREPSATVVGCWYDWTLGSVYCTWQSLSLWHSETRISQTPLVTVEGQSPRALVEWKHSIIFKSHGASRGLSATSELLSGAAVTCDREMCMRLDLYLHCTRSSDIAEGSRYIITYFPKFKHHVNLNTSL